MFGGAYFGQTYPAQGYAGSVTPPPPPAPYITVTGNAVGLASATGTSAPLTAVAAQSTALTNVGS